MGLKSIGTRMDRARTDTQRLKTAWQWADEWEQRAQADVDSLGKALQAGNKDLIEKTFFDLKEDLFKRFKTLPRVMERLADPEDPPYVPKK